MDQGTTRRTFVTLAAAAPLAALTRAPAFAAPEPLLLGRLIRESRALPNAGHVSDRIEWISRGLRGIRYQSNTMIGGPRRAEVLVTRDDAFDCVTYCETVLAAAMARDLDGFRTALRRIRYERGEVSWERRHHYFAEWCRLNQENGICRRVPIEPAVAFDKLVDFANYGRRRVSLVGVSSAVVLANKRRLATGDLIAFMSRRANLDFYHTGLLVIGQNGEPVLRHASQSRARVLDERLDNFIAVNGVERVTLLRAVEAAAQA